MRRFINSVDPSGPIVIGGESGVGKCIVARKILENLYPDLSNPYERILKVDEVGLPENPEGVIVTSEMTRFRELEDEGYSALWIAPLRARIEDIPIFVEYFVSRGEVDEIWMEKDRMNKLLSYWWPYNVSELKRVLKSEDGMELLPYGRLREILSHYSATRILSIKMESFWDDLGSNVNPGKFFHLFLESIEKEFIKSALKHCSYSKKETSELLNIHRNTLNQKIKKLGIKL